MKRRVSPSKTSENEDNRPLLDLAIEVSTQAEALSNRLGKIIAGCKEQQKRDHELRTHLIKARRFMQTMELTDADIENL